VTKDDVIKLFNLLEELYHGHRRSRDNVTLSIWATVLEPWSYAEVRDAVVTRARVNRHFPDPSEIAEFLPLRTKRDDSVGKNMLFCGAEEKLSAHAAEIREKYHAAGLPTPSEAKKQGIGFEAWCDMVAAGMPEHEEKPV
jgi:hypothetical protein